MKKIYQPEVIERADDIIHLLNSTGFFVEYEIFNLDYSKEFLCDILTEKFIKGILNEDIDTLFSEDEFDFCLKNIVIGTYMEELKKKGMVNSITNENELEQFFITEKGKKYLKDNTNQD